MYISLCICRGYFYFKSLNTVTRYFYRKQDKLKSRKAIAELFSNGKSFSNFPFKVIWLPENKSAILQTGIGVSSRYFKKATDRNRIKRLMREAYRLQKVMLQQHLEKNQLHLSVFILYVGRELPDYDMVFEKTGVLLKRLIKLCDENTQAPV